MATKITTLKGKTSGDDIYPNVLTQNIPDGGVTTAKVADSGITAGKIADGAVTTAKIGDGNVTTAKIPDSAITTAKIANSAITTSKIQNGAVIRSKLDIEFGTLADLIRDHAITNLSGLISFIKSTYQFGLLSFYYQDSALAIAPAFASVDSLGAQLDIAYWDGSDMTSIVSLVDDAGFLTFTTGEATKLSLVRFS